MNNIILNEELKIEDMIYEIRGKQVMLDSEPSANKFYGYYDKVIIHYNIGMLVSHKNNVCMGVKKYDRNN